MNNFDEIQSLLQEKADVQARVNLIPYDGSPEIKENAKELRELRRNLRKIEKN